MEQFLATLEKSNLLTEEQLSEARDAAAQYGKRWRWPDCWSGRAS